MPSDTWRLLDDLLLGRQGTTKTRTALMAASACGGERVVRALLEHGARVNDAMERTGYTALHEAAKQGHVMIIQV